MKLKLDLYYVNATSYTKFRVNISEDCILWNCWMEFDKT